MTFARHLGLSKVLQPQVAGVATSEACDKANPVECYDWSAESAFLNDAEAFPKFRRFPSKFRSAR